MHYILLYNSILKEVLIILGTELIGMFFLFRFLFLFFFLEYTFFGCLSHFLLRKALAVFTHLYWQKLQDDINAITKWLFLQSKFISLHDKSCSQTLLMTIKCLQVFREIYSYFFCSLIFYHSKHILFGACRRISQWWNKLKRHNKIE